MEQSCSAAKPGSFRQACEETADASLSQRQSRGAGPSQYSLPKPEMVARECGEMVSETAVQKLSDFLNFLGREGAGKKSRQSVFFQAFEDKKSVLDSIQKRSHSWVLDLYLIASSLIPLKNVRFLN